ncbi:MAG: energy-coupling factor transporter transmembrane protein EcfT [Clostridia bacterium]|nr:energy-coupling factor transporter transmembrane protein EcfT [Clostridia bacterium]
MKNHAFKACHPLVNLLYFVCVIGFSCFSMHPVCLGLSLICGVLYLTLLKGGAAVWGNLVFLLPMAAVMAVMNPLFNHQGVTILWYFPGGNPLTLEAVLYGVLAAGMVLSVLLWFSCLRQVMTDDKVVYLFGKGAPALSLVLSMTFRFVPEFLARFQKVARARQGMGQDLTRGKRKDRLKGAFAILSGVTTWSLENAMDTADSMRARGYGIPGRTAFSIFRLDGRSVRMMGILLVLGGLVLYGGVSGAMDFRCYPAITGAGVTVENLPFFIGYFLLCSCPLFLELWEVKRWNSTKSKP